MDTGDVLADAFGRIVEDFEMALRGLDADDLAWRPDPDANSIAWLTWHATRIQDDHVAALAHRPQTWVEDDFHGRFGLPFDVGDHGWGHTSEQVAAVRPDGPEML
ncbi:MAG: DinB family protein, partial [Actinomycetota bacterium]